MPNFKSVALDVHELLAFNEHKFKMSRDPGHAPFFKVFPGSLGACMPNLKFVFLVVLEPLAFYMPNKFSGSRDPGHAPFSKFFTDHVRTVPGACVPNLKFGSLAVTEIISI